MPPRRKPAAIQVGPPRVPDLTFNSTSLEPFLRQYTRQNSRDTGGGDRQFREEFNLSLRIAEVLTKWRDAPPDAIHHLVTNISDPDPTIRRWYPTLRSQGVSDEVARQNRIIITVLLMQHAMNDRQDGRDGGVSSGGLWLPPRPYALEAQKAATEQGHLPMYPTWSRNEAVAATPRANENWNLSGIPSPQNLDHQGFQTSHSSESPIGNLRPFSSAWAPTSSSSYGPPSSSYGPPSAGFGRFDATPGTTQQYSPVWDRYGGYNAPPPASGFQHRTPNLDVGYTVPSTGTREIPHSLPVSRSYEPEGFDRLSLSTNDPDITPPIRSMGQTRPSPGFEHQGPTTFGFEMNPAPIGSGRPRQDGGGQYGGWQGSRGDALFETPRRERGTSSRQGQGSRHTASGSRHGSTKKPKPDPDSDLGW